MIKYDYYNYGSYEYEIVISVTGNHIIQFWNRTYNRVLFSSTGKNFYGNF